MYEGLSTKSVTKAYINCVKEEKFLIRYIGGFMKILV